MPPTGTTIAEILASMRQLLAVMLAGSVVATGCAGNSYTIPSSELQRLALVPPEARGQRVLVSEELGDTDTEPADRVGPDTEVVVGPRVYVGGAYSWSGGGGGRYTGGNPRWTRDQRTGSGTVGAGGGGSGGSGGAVSGGGGKGGGGGGKVSAPSLGSGGGDGKAAAIAIVVLAATALVVVAAVEGSRYDGWVQMHPMHPVHLVGKDGSQAVMPLAWIDPAAAAWTEKAVVKKTEGPWLELERKPLTRGLTYSMYGGSGSSRSATGDVDFGPSFSIQAGYFPHQQIGILATMGFAWRDNRFGGTLFDSRYMLELQTFPLALGKLHVGGYVGAGLAYRWEDVPSTTITGNNGGTALSAGGMLQLDLHTRLALTARLGVNKAHDDRMTDVLFGLAVY